jgi:Flp pilus assembly secretin CpaC
MLTRRFGTGRIEGGGWLRLWLVVALAASGFSIGIRAQAPPVVQAPSAGVAETIVRAHHQRLLFDTDIRRIAVGDRAILSAELITNREILVLGNETGRTTLLVWFADGTVRETVFSVQRDLSVLGVALTRIHPSIEVESAPDRDAIILTGRVPNVAVSQAAEAVAQQYLEAGTQGAGARPFLAALPAQTPPAPPGAGPPAGAPPTPGTPPGALQFPPGQPQIPPGAVLPAAPVLPAPLETARLQGPLAPVGTIINLIQLETLPPLPEEKIREAIRTLGGQQVTVRRVLAGNVRDDSRDTLVLEGVVPNQIALVRVLEVASQLFAAQTVTADDLRVVADEAGALADDGAQQGQQQSQMGLGLGGAGIAGLGGGRAMQLGNGIQRNLGRATVIEAAGGRILSFIEVSDLPQVRVGIRLFEINRTKLRTYNSDFVALVSDFRQPPLNPARGAIAVQGGGAAKVGSASATAVQEVLSFLGGTLLNQVQFSGTQAAVDLALSLLERRGIARTLSSPSLTVLSGEPAQFQVGGEIPIPVAFSPAFGGAAATALGVFSAVDFVGFGLQLGIRPLVGDDDTITLDVQPRIITPDLGLTSTIRQASGTSPATTAFETRALRTSSRLEDGQALLLGGLTQSNTSRNTAATPGASDVPGLGWLFKNFDRSADSLDLVIVVNPVILRSPIPGAAAWTFPNAEELMRSVTRN